MTHVNFMFLTEYLVAMMEEMNEEQPEIVTYEEEALADEEAVLNKCVSGNDIVFYLMLPS